MEAQAQVKAQKKVEKLSEESIRTCCEQAMKAIMDAVRDETFRQGVDVEDTFIDEVLCNVASNMLAHLVINRESAYKQCYGDNESGISLLQQHAGLSFAKNFTEAYLICLKKLIELKNK